MDETSTRTGRPRSTPRWRASVQGSERRRGARWSTTADIAQRWAWFALPLAGVLWVATRYSHNWYHADEGELIGRTTSSNSWFTAFKGLNAHLQVWSYVIYRLQRTWFGVEGHQLVYIAFCASLAALMLSVAAVLRRLGVPPLIALLAGGLITFFGPGAQDMVWQFQLGANFALALSFAACFVALRDDTTPRSAFVIAALLVAAIGADSAVGAFGVVFVALVVLILWPRRLLVLALGLPAIAYLLWFSFGDLGSYRPVPLGTMTSFASRLFALAAGGLVGGGDTKTAAARALGIPVTSSPIIPLSGTRVGVIALALAGGCVVFGFVRHRLPRKVMATFIGGIVAAVAAVAVIARTRAYFISLAVQGPGSRYVQQVGVFLLVAFVPAIAVTLRPGSRRVRRGLVIVAAAALIAIFVVNLSQLWPIRQFDEGWGMSLNSRVRQAVTVLRDGCGKGSEPDPRADLALTVDHGFTQLPVGLIQDLLATGALTPHFGIPPTRDVRATVCRPSTPPPPAPNPGS